MKKLQVYLSAIVICAGMWSCSTSALLTASFEGDAINSAPATDLPGAPSGDVIEFHTDMTPQLKVQNSSIAGSKALHFTNVSIPAVSGHQRWLSFKGIGTDLTKTIWFTHTGQNTGASHNFLIDISDGHGNLFARMRIATNGEVGLATNILDNYTDVIGNVGSQVHTIIFTVTASTLKYNVTIYPSSGPAISAVDKPMITDNALTFNNPAHPMISFQHSEESGSSHTYALGSVSISKKAP